MPAVGAAVPRLQVCCTPRGAWTSACHHLSDTDSMHAAHCHSLCCMSRRSLGFCTKKEWPSSEALLGHKGTLQPLVHGLSSSPSQVLCACRLWPGNETRDASTHFRINSTRLTCAGRVWQRSSGRPTPSLLSLGSACCSGSSGRRLQTTWLPWLRLCLCTCCCCCACEGDAGA